MEGKFITFEGCEGVGKSRQIKLLSEYLDKNGVDYIVTREPGGDKISEQIREIILNSANSTLTDECEALLYAAARAQHIEGVIKPNLKEGKLVLCDRYVDSSLAYQGKARGLGYPFIEKINGKAFAECMPSCTLFLNLPPEDAFKRKGGADEKDRVEQSGLTFHKAVYEGFLELAKIYPDRIVSIDCSGTKEQTHLKIIEALKAKGVL